MGDARAGGGALRAMGRPKRERPKSGCQPTSEPNPKFEMKGGTGTVSAGFMRDSGALWRDRRDDQALRDRLAEDGYVMLRGALDPSAVRDAAATALASLRRSRPEAFASADAAIDGDVLVAGAQNLGLLSMPEVAELPEVRHVLEHDSLFALADALLHRDPDDGDDGAITAKYKWLRAVAAGEFTGVHVDRVFLGGGGHDRLVTLWIPLSAVRRECGPIMVAAGSHRSNAFAKLRQSYGRSSVGADGTVSGWITDDASHLPGMLRDMNDDGGDVDADVDADVDWRTADFEPGDVVALSADVVHMSASNESGSIGNGKGARVRLSCDTRWQPRSERTDPRIRVWRRRLGGDVVDEVREPSGR